MLTLFSSLLHHNFYGIINFSGLRKYGFFSTAEVFLEILFLVGWAIFIKISHLKKCIKFILVIPFCNQKGLLFSSIVEFFFHGLY